MCGSSSNPSSDASPNTGSDWPWVSAWMCPVGCRSHCATTCNYVDVRSHVQRGFCDPARTPATDRPARGPVSDRAFVGVTTDCRVCRRSEHQVDGPVASLWWLPQFPRAILHPPDVELRWRSE